MQEPARAMNRYQSSWMCEAEIKNVQSHNSIHPRDTRERMQENIPDDNGFSNSTYVGIT